MNILLIDNSPEDIELVKQRLSDLTEIDSNLICVEQFEEGLQILRGTTLDLVLLDFSLPDSQGLQSLRRIHEADPFVPVIVVSDVDDQQLALTAVREGAQDYLVKSRITKEALVRVVRYTVERKRLQDEIRWLASFPEMDPNPVYEADLEANVRYANKAARQMFPDLESGGAQHPLLEGWPDVVARLNRGIMTMFVREIKVDRTWYAQTFSYVPQLRRVRSYLFDIQRQKMAQLQLTQAYRRLKEAQDQLVQSEKMVLVGQLAAGVAHEVKNPLMIVLTGVAYLKTRAPKDDPQMLEVLNDVQAAVIKADEIVRGLLAFSTPTALSLDRRDLNEVIRRTLSLMRHKLDKASVDVQLELEASLPSVSCDDGKLQQVLLNIWINAVDAMPDGGVLTVRTFSCRHDALPKEVPAEEAWMFPENAPVIVMQVDDTGQGLTEEQLARAFEPFYTSKPVGKGTGLGLPIVQKIISQHKGIIKISNRPEGGARVTILLQPEGGEHGVEENDSAR